MARVVAATEWQGRLPMCRGPGRRYARLAARSASLAPRVRRAAAATAAAAAPKAKGARLSGEARAKCCRMRRASRLRGVRTEQRQEQPWRCYQRSVHTTVEGIDSRCGVVAGPATKVHPAAPTYVFNAGSEPTVTRHPYRRAASKRAWRVRGGCAAHAADVVTDVV
eukprot:32085-Chlamydomonas_euryale.AAC.6